VYNLTNGIDVEETNKRVEEYRQVNKLQIARNKAKLDEENRRRRQKEEEERLKLQESADTQSKSTTNAPTAGAPYPGIAGPTRQPLPKNVNKNAALESSRSETLEMMQKRAQAGGYKMDFSLKKAEQEAFSSVVLPT
jgi:hypothetical protein